MKRVIGVLAVAGVLIALAFGEVDHQALRDPFDGQPSRTVRAGSMR